MGKKRVAKKLGEAGPVAGKELKIKSLPQKGVVHVYSSYNNTLVTLTNEQGDKLMSSSAGAAGFSGSKRARHTRPRAPPLWWLMWQKAAV